MLEVVVIVFPQEIVFLLIDLQDIQRRVVGLRSPQNLQDLEDVETSLDCLTVSWDKVAVLAELVLHTMVVSLFHIPIFKMVADLVELVDLFFLFRASYFEQVNVDHFAHEILHINFS